MKFKRILVQLRRRILVEIFRKLIIFPRLKDLLEFTSQVKDWLIINFAILILSKF